MMEEARLEYGLISQLMARKRALTQEIAEKKGQLIALFLATAPDRLRTLLQARQAIGILIDDGSFTGKYRLDQVSRYGFASLDELETEFKALTGASNNALTVKTTFSAKGDLLTVDLKAT